MADEQRCPICWARLAERAVTNPCYHEFCFKCVTQWLTTRLTCPTCRQEVATVRHSFTSVGVFDIWRPPQQEQRQAEAAIGEPLVQGHDVAMGLVVDEWSEDDEEDLEEEEMSDVDSFGGSYGNDSMANSLEFDEQLDELGGDFIGNQWDDQLDEVGRVYGGPLLHDAQQWLHHEFDQIQEFFHQGEGEEEHHHHVEVVDIGSSEGDDEPGEEGDEEDDQAGEDDDNEPGGEDGEEDEAEDDDDVIVIEDWE